VLVLVTHSDDPEPVIAEGRWHGRVIDTPRGSGGFGYDAHFEDVGVRA
jgi:XTP/dITP diphosphohydrolase